MDTGEELQLMFISILRKGKWWSLKSLHKVVQKQKNIQRAVVLWAENALLTRDFKEVRPDWYEIMSIMINMIMRNMNIMINHTLQP